MLPKKIGDLARKPPAIINGTRRHFFCRYDTVCKQDTVIIVTEGGRLVNNTCAIGIGDIAIDKNPKSLVRILRDE